MTSKLWTSYSSLFSQSTNHANVVMGQMGPACVCVFVCPFVYVCHLHSLNGSFFSDFCVSNLITLWRSFCNFSIRHSHGRNLLWFSLKTQTRCKVVLRYLLLKTNKTARLVTSANMADRVFEKIKIPTIFFFFFLYRESKVSIFTTSGPLITNIATLCPFD